MKKIIIILFTILLLSSCTSKSFDGKDRPSNRGQLQVIDNKLCGEDGNTIMLRGISNNGVSISERYINQECFDDIAKVMGANVIRMSLYTSGTGTVGYCNGGDKNRLKQDIYNAVEYAKNSDMYIIIDWHVLQDQNPNKYIEDAKVFFDEISKELKDEKHIIYEICNEPNNCTWDVVSEYANTIIPIIRNNDENSLILVGSPDWSKDLKEIYDKPLSYDNIMYTFHFYAETHKQEYQDIVKQYSDKGLPLFISEFGICTASAGFPINEEEANKWIELCENEGISYVMWSFAKNGEPCSAISTQCVKTKNFTYDDFSFAGKWLIDTIKKYTN